MTWEIYHNKAFAHALQLIHNCLLKDSNEQLLQLPYSPDMTLCNFWLFRKLKIAFKQGRLEDVKTMQQSNL